MKTNQTEIAVPVLSEQQIAEFTDNSCIQKNVAESFGDALQRYMDELKIERDMLAKLTGIGETSIHYYLHGEREISADHLTAICIALRLHPMKSKYLFSLTHHHLCSNNARDMLCITYLYACAFNENFDLLSCNQLLKRRGMYPLTLLIKKSDTGA